MNTQRWNNSNKLSSGDGSPLQIMERFKRYWTKETG